MARTGTDGLAQELLDREKFHKLRTDRFAPLFDDHQIGTELAQQFPEPVEVVMLALWIVIDPALTWPPNRRMGPVPGHRHHDPHLRGTGPRASALGRRS
jgi:hypothetical protein